MMYELVRRRRRTVAIIVKPGGQVVVRAPERAALAEIERFVEAKQDWIRRHVQRSLALQAPAKRFVPGERFWYLGQQYELEFSDRCGDGLEFTGSRFILPALKAGQAGELFLFWYQEAAKAVLTERVRLWAGRMQVGFSRMSITAARTRWGSCSARGRINFSRRLVMAPLHIIDYVAVHELAHLVHHNHSKKFWRMVAQFYPAHKEARLWLNRSGSALRFF